MTDKLLNLLAAIQDENPLYQTYVYPTDRDDWDFGVSCTKHYNAGEATSFIHNPVIEVLNDFSEYGYQSYCREEGPYPATTDDVMRHTVEILVRR